VKFDNETLYTYIRPTTAGQSAIKTNSNPLSFSSSGKLVFAYLPVDDSATTGYYLFISPNWANKDNIIYKYLVQPQLAGASVTTVRFVYVSEFNIRLQLVTAIAVTPNFVAYGCEACNKYLGRV
jgi:hypothetical protein